MSHLLGLYDGLASRSTVPCRRCLASVRVWGDQAKHSRKKGRPLLHVHCNIRRLLNLNFKLKPYNLELHPVLRRPGL